MFAKITLSGRGEESVRRTTRTLSYVYLSPRALFNVAKRTAARPSGKTRSNVYFARRETPRRAPSAETTLKFLCAAGKVRFVLTTPPAFPPPSRRNDIFANTMYGSLHPHAHPVSHFRASMLARTANLTRGGVTRGLPRLSAQKVTKLRKARADLSKEAKKQHEDTYKMTKKPARAPHVNNM